MKKIVLFFFCMSFIANVFSQEPITNKDIIMMKSSKMSSDIIISKIRSSPCEFDLTTAGILELKNAKITDNVIKEMLTACPPKEAMTNDDVINMYQSKVTSSVIIAKIEVTEHDFDVSPEGLIKLTAAKIPKTIVKKMMETPSGMSVTNDDASRSKGGNSTSKKVLRHEDVPNAGLFKNFDEYIAKDGSVFKKGDLITLNFPTKDGRYFQYVYKRSNRDKEYLEASYSNRQFRLVEVAVDRQDLIFGGKNFKYAILIVEGEGFLAYVYIDIENAIASGEVKSTIITEAEALETIKKAKEKFDLDLITEEEYSKIREEMKQYIK